jgi:hypothetical protein
VGLKYGSLWVGGVLMMFMSCMGWVYEKKIKRGWGEFLVILDLRWVTVPRLDFGNDVWYGDPTLGSFSEVIWYCLL